VQDICPVFIETKQDMEYDVTSQTGDDSYPNLWFGVARLSEALVYLQMQHHKPQQRIPQQHRHKNF